MFTVKTSNPNYTHIDSDFDYSDPVAYFESAMGISGYDSSYYLGEDSDGTYCDCALCECESFGDFVGVFKIKRNEILLFTELESIAEFHLWRDQYGNVNTLEIDNESPLPHYALGL